MPPILLFSYGTLLDEKIQRRVFGRILRATPARLDGWQVVPRVVRGRFPGIVPVAGKSTRGFLLELASGDLVRVDAYEDTPFLYRRRRVTVRVARRSVRCWVYVPTDVS